MPSGACIIRRDGVRGAVWSVKFRDADGRQVKQRLGTESEGWNRRKAERELRHRLADVDRNGYRKPAPLTFAAWSSTWYERAKERRAWKPATVVAHRRTVELLDEHFGTVPLAAIRPRDVADYVRVALAAGYAAKTVNVNLSVLHDVMREAVREELIEANPVTGVERPKVDRTRWRILAPAEVPRVAAAFTDERARSAFLTLILTGLRRQELRALRWGDVSLGEGTLRVRESKTEAGERVIALASGLVDELARHFQRTAYRSDADYVFAHPERGSALDGDWYRAQFAAALAEAGIEGRVRAFHDMRHSALTNLAAAGASLFAVMGTAGHRSASTTRQYVNLAGVVFRDEASALERRLLPVPESGTNSPETALLSEAD